MHTDELQAYHKHISDTYNERSVNHDRSGWHKKTALRLLEDLPPRSGDSVLDIATGTGTIAFRAASLVMPDGNVTGVDISQGMLDQARQKLSLFGPDNLKFRLADAEHLDFSMGSFDRIYCASAFFCFLDPVLTLKDWFGLLKPGGALGFHAFPESSYFWVSVTRNILARHGFKYNLNTPTGTIEKTHQLLVDAGFINIDIREERAGYFIPLDEAKKTWIKKEDFVPGQYPHPVEGIPPEMLSQCQKEYEQNMDELSSGDGVWNDITMFYVYAHK